MHDSVLEARLVMKSYCLHLLFKSCVSGLDFPIPMQSLQIKLEIPEPTVFTVKLNNLNGLGNVYQIVKNRYRLDPLNGGRNI